MHQPDHRIEVQPPQQEQKDPPPQRTYYVKYVVAPITGIGFVTTIFSAPSIILQHLPENISSALVSWIPSSGFWGSFVSYSEYILALVTFLGGTWFTLRQWKVPQRVKAYQQQLDEIKELYQQQLTELKGEYDSRFQQIQQLYAQNHQNLRELSSQVDQTQQPLNLPELKQSAVPKKFKRKRHRSRKSHRQAHSFFNSSEPQPQQSESEIELSRCATNHSSSPAQDERTPLTQPEIGSASSSYGSSSSSRRLTESNSQ